MDRGTAISRGLLAASVALVAAFGCERANPYKLSGDTTAHDDCPPQHQGAGNAGQGANNGEGANGAGNADGSELEERTLDYSEALRVASIKLVGNLPTLDQIYALGDEPEETKPEKYAQLLDEMLSDPRFVIRMQEYWRDVFKMYGDGIPIDDDDNDLTPPVAVPSREFAVAFAARVVVEGRPWTDLLTANSNTCPTFDVGTGLFTDGECGNGITSVGVLSDPGIQSLYWGNLSFRRNRFFHETFLCRSGNAPGGWEPSDDPSTVGPCGTGESPPNYTSPWPMSSFSGACNSGPVDFHEYNTSTVCGNCHGTQNHRAPLHANFDRFGEYMASPQVHVPVEGSPFAVREDWLPLGEPTAWKFGMEAATLAEMGDVMASDPEVIACGIKRVYNYAMSRGDIVANETPVPEKIIEEYLVGFEENNYDMRQLLKDVLVSDDFVRF